MRLPYVFPMRIIAPVVTMLRIIFVAVPALRRVEPVTTSGPVGKSITRSAADASASLAPGVSSTVARTQPDVVVPVPDSGVPAAIGYAAASGIPFELGIIRSHWVLDEQGQARPFLPAQATPKDTRTALVKALQPRTAARIAMVDKALKDAGLLN